MTSLQSYLAAGAVEDVRHLLANGCVRRVADVDLLRFRLYRNAPAHNAPAWTSISVAIRIAGLLQNTKCFYRKPDHGQFIVSDCGETVCEVMRRTGLDGRQASLRISDLIEGQQVAFGHGVITRRTHGADPADLPAAIVAVLSAVAKVRAELDKEQP